MLTDGSVVDSSMLPQNSVREHPVTVSAESLVRTVTGSVIGTGHPITFSGGSILDSGDQQTPMSGIYESATGDHFREQARDSIYESAQGIDTRDLRGSRQGLDRLVSGEEHRIREVHSERDPVGLPPPQRQATERPSTPEGLPPPERLRPAERSMRGISSVGASGTEQPVRLRAMRSAPSSVRGRLRRRISLTHTNSTANVTAARNNLARNLEATREGEAVRFYPVAISGHSSASQPSDLNVPGTSSIRACLPFPNLIPYLTPPSPPISTKSSICFVSYIQGVSIHVQHRQYMSVFFQDDWASLLYKHSVA